MSAQILRKGNLLMACKILIVGGIAGGASAESMCLDEKAEIITFERGSLPLRKND